MRKSVQTVLPTRTDHLLQPSTYGLAAGRLRLDFLELRKRSGATRMTDGKERSELESVFFERKAVKRLIDGERANDYVAVQFGEASHWRLLVLFGSERKAVYWNPYGIALPRRHALRSKIDGIPGWSLHSITHALQPSTDDYQCGIWVHEGLRLFLKYASTSNRISSAGFEDCFTQQISFTPIPQPSALSRWAIAAAIRTNVEHAKQVHKS